jgi:hypothetical protein
MVVLSLRGQRSFELLIFSLLVIIVCHTFINLGAFCLVDVKFCNCTTHNNMIVGLMVYLFFCFWFIINRQIYISTKILKSSIKRMWIVNLLYFHCGWENVFFLIFMIDMWTKPDCRYICHCNDINRILCRKTYSIL